MHVCTFVLYTVQYPGRTGSIDPDDRTTAVVDQGSDG